MGLENNLSEALPSLLGMLSNTEHKRPLYRLETTHTPAPGYPAADKSGKTQYVFEFENGYSASVIRGPYTYGGPSGLWELAVLNKNGIDYSTPITDDVEGHLTDADVESLLTRIETLPPMEDK